VYFSVVSHSHHLNYFHHLQYSIISIGIPSSVFFHPLLFSSEVWCRAITGPGVTEHGRGRVLLSSLRRCHPWHCRCWRDFINAFRACLLGFAGNAARDKLRRDPTVTAWTLTVGGLSSLAPPLHSVTLALPNSSSLTP
jgi:hypothetical protein